MTSVKHLLICSSVFLALSGCGSSDDTPPVESPSYALSGTVSGLNGTVIVGVNDTRISISQNGSISLGNNFKSGNQVSLSIKQQPTNQICAITSATTLSFSNTNIENVTVACENLPTFNISGTATGLLRPVTLQYQVNGSAEASLNIDEQGAFVLNESFAAGTAITFSVADSIGHSCSVTPTEVTVDTAISNLVLNCSTFGALSGRVTSYGTGLPISNADVSAFVISANNISSLLQQTTTDQTGRFTIGAVGYQQRIVVQAASTGFASRSDVARTSENNAETTMSIALLAADVVTTFDASAAAVISDTNSAMQVSLPASAFVTSEGLPATGSITAALTNVDASSDPAIMPGYYLATNPQTGNVQAIESFGAINAQFTDASGKALQLAQGVDATIRIPVAERADTPPATIPLMHFNQQTGIWDVEGEATLQIDEMSRPYYLGSVSHFSTWNADVLFESVRIIGCVFESDSSERLANVRIVADGTDYIGRSVTYSNSEGEFDIAVRPNSQVLLSVRDADGQSNTRIIDVGTTDYDLENCLAVSTGAMTVTLTWGENPNDLDTHFLGPRTANSVDDRFRIYFSKKQEMVNDITMYLDRDDVSSFGPEVLTVPQFPVAGRYRYAVHHYAGSGTVFQSPTRVEARVQGETFIFSPTMDEDTNSELDSWVVFDVVVTSEGVINVVPVNTYMRRGSEDIADVANGTTSFSKELKSIQ
ncbi:carboxypeptidase-like regulatory domain-containing protein [Rheinheimera baltica]|uniref:carboxypeptidase-like regulatory domain-containing protein n=1 Tax=Rheinheimera baltica TaxID=67576 RepID=UPI00273D6134|nr:carboxypeptidase-like regulatory domain-containing protein [Rheinheimera baltica]MDP5188760.1 carboxypeptidase-like regulatory domain-containing protein [Rheinheimera baltica]